jgi:hypothetical protein
MGAGLMGYAVDVDYLREEWTKRETELAIANTEKVFLREHAAALASIDETTRAREGGSRTSLEALRDVLHQRPLDPESGAAYAYVLELFCRLQDGSARDNSNVYPLRAADLEELDAFFRRRLPEDELLFSSLVFGGAPVTLPRHDGAPSIGHLTHERCLRAVDALTTTGVMTRESEIAFAEVDFDESGAVADAASQIVRWLDHVYMNREYGLGIVCFYY